MNIYRITLKSQVKAAKDVLFFLVIGFLAIFIVHLMSIDNLVLISKCIFGLTILIIAPSIYLHLVYFWENAKYRIEEYEDYFVLVDSLNGSVILNDESIIEIKVYMSPAYIQYHTTSGSLPNESYYFACFKTRDKVYNVTCLLYADIKKLVSKYDQKKVEFISTIFANIQ